MGSNPITSVYFKTKSHWHVVKLPKTMTTITFTDGATKEVVSVHLNEAGNTLFADGGSNRAAYDTYDLFGVKSIIPPKEGAPTKLQTDLTNALRRSEYFWDKKHSTSAACVILKRADGDFWLFGMEGEIMHNPEALLTVKL
jgi:hypothetical protein